MRQELILETRRIYDSLAPMMFPIGLAEQLAPFENTNINAIPAYNAPKISIYRIALQGQMFLPASDLQ